MAKGFELKDNSMSLLKNGYKEEGDNRPDYTGDAKVGGVDMKASLWINKTKSGATNLRGQFQLKEEKSDSDSPF
jgi:hypothetical protein|tara:strand:- start:240 stop:461 length:222 start_codon:yes stop_codon:yes gene_type:complete